MNFSEAVRNARRKSGFSQTALAEAAGVSVHAVWELEVNGNGTMEVLDAVCKVLDLRFAGLPKGTVLADRVAALRNRRGLSVAALADLAGVSPGAVRRVENGTARVQNLSAILDALRSEIRVRQHERAIFAGGGRDERYTPRDDAEKIAHVMGGEIDLDPCGHPDSPVEVHRRYTANDDGLKMPWDAETVYCNPPFSQATSFMKKAHHEWSTGRAKQIILLLPSRTNSLTMHDLVFRHADVFFPRGRMFFLTPEGQCRTIPFAVLFAYFGATPRQIEAMANAFPSAHLRRTVVPAVSASV